MASSHTVSMVRFMNMSAQLTDTEMDTFMKRFWREVDRDRMLLFLCTSLPSGATNQEHPDLLPIASGIISQIIEERESDNKHIERVPLVITNLPSSLIAEIASNLDSSTYVAFSKTNRNLFVDCNSPN